MDSLSDTTNRSWSTKHMSATGRMNEQPVRGSKLIGAQVNDSSGNRAGRIQDIIVSPSSGRIDFALLSLSASGSSPGAPPNTSGRLVPVPWSLLKTSSSSQYTNSEQPVFTLKNVDQNKLNGAPAVNFSDLSQSEWRQRIYAYYGVTPPPVGGAESPEGETKGEGSRKVEPTPPNP
jgi:sporulation protein YlmC with PRC-barrel domain